MTTELTQSPSDAISRILFAPTETSNLLLVASWDNSVRLYDVDLNTVRGVHLHDHAVLDCCFLRGPNACASGGLARDLRQYDFEREEDFLIGKHSEAVRCVRFAPETGLVFSGSWDKTVGAWDARTKNICHRLNIEAKVFAMACTPTEGAYGKIVVGGSDKRIHIYDYRKLEKAEEIRENVVRYQIRCIETFADGKGFAVGSVEGRVAYEYLNPKINATKSTEIEHPEDLADRKSYAFRCHREKIKEDDPILAANPDLQANISDRIYPVNSIAFHNRYNTFATGGGDGLVSVWDGLSKKRLWKLSKAFPTAITSLAFSNDGSRLALAVSSDFSQGTHGTDPRLMSYAQVIVRDVTEEDVRPKSIVK
eukprot:Gregarina_sp_Poly_1__1379@NODE_1341_length_4343_cov_180_690131_g429_i1_p2_GENE_NODE_1341_length_4343_cov_180_690131_g429_i1NODE_1341_length_4343_cov_180_690131_g429_i1_p2_ORF_typecomplete_len366_score42_36ANAPC4_WD40/PF12894_7/4_6e09ANAPC4_WD40/PF12894_7/1_8ANAPC4_WD40/PF12894_7/0_23ANAPC4_WD40/PF12894_7/0_002ANAPC4_WD40/PF12894_7/1_1e06WD40/PF00400_32/1_2WD40/PF00400_32/2e03WD40/PF00400_32/3_2e05WD40/PF00400_32/60WD40/PF00400_32/7_4e02WD40/PF00400_32/0_00011WD40/PF00400_32/0_31WD40_like/PF17005